MTLRLATKDLVGVNLRHAHAEVAINPRKGLGFLAEFKPEVLQIAEPLRGALLSW